MFFGHIPEILGLLLLALLIFGPKRMVEMGSSFGKMFREFRDATREMSWSNLLGDADDGGTARTHSSPSAPTYHATREEAATATSSSPDAATIVDGSIERRAEM